MKRILTGLQPTGVITLGNYIGAIKQMTKLQDEYDSIIFIADMHAITIPQDKEELPNKIKSLVPDKTTYHSYKYATSVHIHQDVDNVLNILKEMGEPAYVIGKVTDSGIVDLKW